MTKNKEYQVSLTQQASQLFKKIKDRIKKLLENQLILAGVLAVQTLYNVKSKPDNII